MDLLQDRDFILRSRHDVKHFNKVIWGEYNKPWSKQWEIWESVRDHKRTTVRSGHSTGKSFIGARMAIWSLFCWPNSYVITTAPTARQVEKVLWAEIRDNYAKSKIKLGGNLLPKAPELQLGAKWQAFGFTTGKGAITDVGQTPMAGFHSNVRVLVIIDEAAGVVPGLFGAAESIATGSNDRILAIGNPTDPKSDFAESFGKPDSTDTGGWNKIKISTLESPNVLAGRDIVPGLASHTWPDEMKVAWGEKSPMYIAKVLAEFPEEGEDTLIPLRFIQLALERRIEDIDEVPEWNNLGVDVARFGGDNSIGYHLVGPYAERLFRLSKKDTVQVGQKINEHNSKKKFKRINIDDDGVGGGVTDHLKRVVGLRNVVRINGAGKASDPKKYLNKRAELAFKLRERFVEKQDIILDSEATGAQLAAYKYDYVTRNGIDVYKLEEKKQLKKRLKRSPDEADSLIYASEDKKPVDWSKAIQFT